MKVKHMFLTAFFLGFCFMLMACSSSKNVEFRIEGSILNFEEIENANINYRVYAINEIGEEKSQIVKSGFDLNELKLNEGKYTIYVVQNNNGDEKLTSFENGKEYIQGIRKLDTPTSLEIINKKLVWNEVENAVKYIVLFVCGEEEVEKELEPNFLISNQGLKGGNYKIKVKAIGDGINNLDSDYSVEIDYIIKEQKLNAPANVYIEDDKIYFDEVSGAKEYMVSILNETSNYEFELENGLDLKGVNIPNGNYNIKVKAISMSKSVNDSDYSNEIQYTKETKIMTLSKDYLKNNKYIKYSGRTYYNETTFENEIYHSASSFEVFFKGSMLNATITATNYYDTTKRPCLVIVINDDFENATTIFLSKKETVVPLIRDNKSLDEIKVTVYKRSESIDSHIGLKELKGNGLFIEKIENKERKIEFIAASSSTGYGNLSKDGKTTANSDALKAFAFLTAQNLNADISIFSASGWGCKASQWTTPNSLNVYDAYKYVDFMSDIKWDYANYIPDVVVINLGTNDWSYINAASTPEEKDSRSSAFQNQYIEFLKHINSVYEGVQIVVLYGLMNEKDIYEMTESIVLRAKNEIPNLVSIKINGDAGGYNSHPSVQSHKEISDKLTTFIKTTMNW